MLPTAPIVYLALFSSALARPKIQRRGLPGGVYHCTGVDFTGDCGWTPPTDTCHEVGQAAGAKSLGPDEGGSCLIWDRAGCTGNVIRQFNFPGLKNIDFDYASFNCRADSVYTTTNVSKSDAANSSDSNATPNSASVPDKTSKSGSDSISDRNLTSSDNTTTSTNSTSNNNSTMTSDPMSSSNFTVQNCSPTLRSLELLVRSNEVQETEPEKEEPILEGVGQLAKGFISGS